MNEFSSDFHTKYNLVGWDTKQPKYQMLPGDPDTACFTDLLDSVVSLKI